jgi:hypothetical protein
MIDVVEVKAEIESGNLATEMHEQCGKWYLILKDIESGESVCIWREEWEQVYIPDEIVIEGRPDWCPLEEIKEE